MRKFSAIVPVYNRPDEVDELLESLTQQSYSHFEVVIIEDGSSQDCKDIVKKYEGQLNIRYFFKENGGQGFARNFGYEKANGDYWVVFDSDAVVPPQYFQVVNQRLDTDWLDAYGGPDAAHDSFTPLQKAISYSMTSLFTTGGIRGRKQHIGQFHPRSFNMGISPEVFKKTKGYIITRMAEDIEFSIRIIENQFKVGLIEEAFVYHKRRTSLRQFWKQLHFFGRARINLSRFYPKELKAVHAFPAIFLLGLLGYGSTALWSPLLFSVGGYLLGLYFALIFLDATLKNKVRLDIGLLSIATSFTQLAAYGVGFLAELGRKVTGNKEKCLERQFRGEKV